ncbi:MAG: MG2 domain-containing protein, partial [Hyphomicrobiales bacterium]
MRSRYPAGPAAFLLILLTVFTTGLHAQDASVADRRVIVSEGADYFGFDYRVVKKTSLDNCKQVCLRDDECRAFTYNTQARWCFLKTDHGELKSAENSVAGRVVATATKPAETAKPPALTFLPNYFQDEAERYAARLRGSKAEPQQGAHALREAAKVAMTGGKPKRAIRAYRAALRFEPGDHGLWVELAYAALAVKSDNYSETAKLLEEATSVALNAYAISASAGQRALSLALLATALERRQQFRPALEAYKASLLLADTAWVRSAYDKLHAQRGFRIVDYTVDSESASPRICIRFSEKLRTRNTDYATFVTVNDGAPAAVDAKGQQVCIDGAKHGQRYRVGVRAGIPSAIGEVLERPTALNIYVRDRSATVRFTGRNYVLPRFPGHGIPMVTVNTEAIDVTLYRVGERALSEVIGSNQFFEQLNKYSGEQLGDTRGDKIWQGELAVESALNKEVTTRFPIDQALPERKPGVYVMVAHPKGAKTKDWNARATQWFIVSDIGLSVLTGDDGLHVFVRSLSSAKAIATAEIKLIARNNEILGTATTDADGHAHFTAGLARGKGGVAPALVTASAGGVDYAFLNVTKPGFDLSDRGVEGRTAPGPLDVFLYTERGVYRPGATVHLSALVRDRNARAASDLPLTFVFRRPDGVQFRRVLSQDKGLGGHAVDLDLLSTAMRGTWRVSAYSDPKSAPLAEHQFLVEDFIPDRIEFDLTAETEQLALEGSAQAKVAGRFLYGAPASGLRLEGELTVRATSTVKSFEDYSFGLSDEQVLPVRTPLPELPATDSEGNAVINVALDELPETTRPLEASVTVRMREASG